MQTLILVLVLQCSTRLMTCNFSENELIPNFARVFTSLKLPGIQYISGEISGKLLCFTAALCTEISFWVTFLFIASILETSVRRSSRAHSTSESSDTCLTSVREHEQAMLGTADQLRLVLTCLLILKSASNFLSGYSYIFQNSQTPSCKVSSVTAMHIIGKVGACS